MQTEMEGLVEVKREEHTQLRSYNKKDLSPFSKLATHIMKEVQGYMCTEYLLMKECHKERDER